MVARETSLAEFGSSLRPPADVAREFRASGWWRSETVLHDLYRIAATYPDRPAIISHRSAGARIVSMTYGQVAQYVDRFAGGLAALGLSRGDPVAYQLPNWWETTALTFACLRLGLIAVPISTSVREPELEFILRTSQARACVVVENWAGYAHAEALANMADRLPWLRYRILAGGAAPTGSVDFAEHFLRTPHERRLDAGLTHLGLDDADRVCLMLFPGLAGRPWAVLQSHNTLYAASSAPADPAARSWHEDDVFASTHSLAHPAAMLYPVLAAVLAGGTGVYQDEWDPEVYLDLLARTQATHVFASAAHWSELVAAQQRSPRRLPVLRCAATEPAQLPPQLALEVEAALGVPLRVAWGTAEVGFSVRAIDGDAPPWSPEHGGRTLPGLETSLVPVTNPRERTFRLRARGPSVCLGTLGWGSGELRATWGQGDGWLDIGRVVRRDDGRGLSPVRSPA